MMKKLLVFTIVFLVLISCGNDEKKSENDSDISSDNSVVNDEDNTLDEDVAEESENDLEEDNDITESTPDPDLVQTDEDVDDSDEEPDEDSSYNPYATCEDLIICFNGCDDPDNCEECGNIAGEKVLEDYYNFRTCIDSKCSQTSSEDIQECIYSSCYCEKYFCIGTSMCIYTPEAPFGTVNINAEFDYAVLFGEDTSEHSISTPVFTGSMGVDSLESFRLSEGVESYFTYYEESQEKYLAVFQQSVFDENVKPEYGLLKIVISFSEEAIVGQNQVGITVDDNVQLWVFGENDCIHGVGIGVINISEIEFGELQNAKLKVDALDMDLYSLYNVPQYGGDISESPGLNVCPILDQEWRSDFCERL